MSRALVGLLALRGTGRGWSPLNFLSALFPDLGSTNRGAPPVMIGAAQMAIIEA